jgi:hydrophobic/amphiphilic exporter-1 (mainly G- bacteria), HAE1 family
MLPLYGLLLGATVWVTGHVQLGFIPTLDQGYGIIVAQLPDGSSLSRTDEVTRRISEIALKVPGVRDAVAFAGFSAATFTNATNSAAVFVPFKPFDERVKTGRDGNTIIRELNQRLHEIQEAFIIVISPPPVRGIGTAGGFKFETQNRNSADVRSVLAAAYELMDRARQDPKLSGVFTTFSANSPQIYLQIDRQKAQMLNVPIGNIFEVLQDNLGVAYVNDFNLFGRVFQVRAQADQSFRVDVDDINRLRVRSSTGALVPMGTLAEVQETSGPELVQRYNMYTSVPLQGNPGPGVSSDVALSEMEKLADEVLPRGMSYEWTDLAFQEHSTGSTAIFVFMLSVIFVFLVLAAQYESLVDPLFIIMAVPLAILGALGAVYLRGTQNDIFCQVGLVMLVGLASKNAILIVQFGNLLRSQGVPVAQAALQAAQTRLRPILMTSFAFIFGIMPLVFASGAGQNSRHSLGTAVVGGMLVSTLLNLVIIPLLYMIIAGAEDRFRERRARRAEQASE